MANGKSRRNILCGLAAIGLFGGLGGEALAQADLVTLKVGNSSATLNSAPLLLATAVPEIFAKHGLKLEVQDFRGSAQNTITAIISNAVDIAFVGTAVVNDAVAEGAQLKTIAVPTRPMSEIFLSPAAVKKTGVSVDAPSEARLRALKGLRLSSSGIGGSHYTFLAEMLRPLGMSIADVQFSTLTDPIAMIQAIRYNQIDGSMWTIGPLSALLKDGAGVRWISMVKDAPALKDIPFITVIAQSAWVDKHPDLVEKFRAGLVDAIARLKQDPVNSSKLIKAKYFPDLDQSVWDDGFEQALPTFFDDAKASRKEWDLLLKLQAPTTKKDYSNAQFEKSVVPAARAN